MVYRLNGLSLVFALGHHVDHAIRGTHIGWPLISEVNPFTASLTIYPIVIASVLLYHRELVGHGTLAFVTGGGALFLAIIHFGPWAVEPAIEIIDHYPNPILGWLAFAWLVALVVIVVATCAYEINAWRADRKAVLDTTTTT